MAGQRLLLGVDGGNSKTHVALADAGGGLLAAVAGPTVSHQQVGMGRAMERLVALAAAAAERAGIDAARRPLVEVASLCSAGADLASDMRRLGKALAATGMAGRGSVHNDAFAALRAGAPHGWGVAVICGAGVNCVGRAPDGRTAAFPALGDISGDWGGGSSVGMAALQAALRARDGRGPRTGLERAVPAQFGVARPIDVTAGLYHGRLRTEALRDLAPVVFAVAAAGDQVARGILDHLADELATMAIAILRRLHLLRREVDVVLAGGFFRAGDEAFVARIAEAVRRAAPGARVVPLGQPPVLGALLLALDELGPAPGAEERLRAVPIEPVPVQVA